VNEPGSFARQELTLCVNASSPMKSDKRESTLESLLRGSIFSFSGLIIHQIAGVGLRVVLARYLTPEEFGLVNLGLAVMIIVASLSLMGYQNGVTRFIAFYNGRGERNKTKASVISALCFVIPSGLFAGLMVFVFSRHISLRVFHNEGLVPLLEIFAAAIPLYALTEFAVAGLRGLKKIHLVVLTDRILWRLLPLAIFPLIFIYLDLRVTGAAYAFLVTIIAMCLTSGFLLYREVAPYPTSADTKACFKEISRFSWPLGLVNITNNMKTRADIFLLGLFLGAVEVGLFSVASTLSAFINLFLSSVVIIFAPVASELYSRRDTKEIARIFSLVTKWLFLLVFPLVLILIIFPERSIVLLFGGPYEDAVPILVILSTCYFVKTVVGPTGATVLAMGRSRTYMNINLATVIIGLGLALTLIPTVGVIGAALAAGLSTAFQQISMLYVVKRHIRLHLFKSKMVLYAMYCILAIVLFALLFEQTMTNLLSFFLGCCCFYLVALLGIIITKQLEHDDLLLIDKIRDKLVYRMKPS